MIRMSAAWRGFQEHLAAGGSAQSLGLSGTDGDVSRFLARYRLAASFDGLQLRGYSKATTAAYSALTGLFFAYGAFELFAGVMGLSEKGQLQHARIKKVLDAHEIPPLDPVLSRAGGIAIRIFLAEHLTNSRLRQAIAPPGMPSSHEVSQALRHAFVHGPLTAHSGTRKPALLTRGASELSGWMLDAMAIAFAARVLRP